MCRQVKRLLASVGVVFRRACIACGARLRACVGFAARCASWRWHQRGHPWWPNSLGLTALGFGTSGSHLCNGRRCPLLQLLFLWQCTVGSSSSWRRIRSGRRCLLCRRFSPSSAAVPATACNSPFLRRCLVGRPSNCWRCCWPLDHDANSPCSLLTARGALLLLLSPRGALLFHENHPLRQTALAANAPHACRNRC